MEFFLKSIACAILFAAFSSFADVLSERILIAFYKNSRKRIKNKFVFIFQGRSKCQGCQKVISPVYLIPIFGYFLSKRQCPNCKSKIALRHPIIETLSLLYGFSIASGSISYLAITLLGFILVYIIARIDFHYFLIPTEAIVALFIISLVDLSIKFKTELLTNNLSIELILILVISFSWYIFFYLIRIISNYSLGLADVRLTLVLSLSLSSLGASLLPSSAALLGICYYILQRKKLTNKLNRLNSIHGKPMLPFGTFLAIAWLLWRGAQVFNILFIEELLNIAKI